MKITSKYKGGDDNSASARHTVSERRQTARRHASAGRRRAAPAGAPPLPPGGGGGNDVVLAAIRAGAPCVIGGRVLIGVPAAMGQHDLILFKCVHPKEDGWSSGETEFMSAAALELAVETGRARLALEEAQG